MPKGVYMRNATIQDRFWANVTKTANCWNWIGGSSHGYGSIRTTKANPLHRAPLISAHRLSWIIHFGPIANDLHVLHKCDNRLCVNPSHLFLGSNTDNVADRVAKNRTAMGEKHYASKLTEQQVRAILESQKSGPELAQELNVKPWTVYKIRQGKNWKHITKHS